jgi:hypothetical protein
MENAPVTVNDAVMVIVETPAPEPGVNVSVAHVWAVSTVHMKPTNPELALNTTSSVAIGTDAPVGVPVGLADQ